VVAVALVLAPVPQRLAVAAGELQAIQEVQAAAVLALHRALAGLATVVAPAFHAALRLLMDLLARAVLAA
jgi:hypothetical protein